jgi:hypothetical protein
LKDQIKNRMSQGNWQAPQPDNETTNNCSESFVDYEPLRPETQEEVSVSPASTSTFTGEEVESEPRVSVPQRSRKRPNTVLGEALLNVEQQKLDYLKQKKYKEIARVFQWRCMSSSSSSPRVYCLTLQKFRWRGNCFSGARFKSWYISLLTKDLKTARRVPSPEFTQHSYSLSPQSSGTVHAEPVQFETQVTGYSGQWSLHMQSLNWD